MSLTGFTGDRVPGKLQELSNVSLIQSPKIYMVVVCNESIMEENTLHKAKPSDMKNL